MSSVALSTLSTARRNWCQHAVNSGPVAGFYRAPLQNSYLKTVIAEKIIKFLYSFSQKAFHGEYQ